MSYDNDDLLEKMTAQCAEWRELAWKRHQEIDQLRATLNERLPFTSTIARSDEVIIARARLERLEALESQLAECAAREVVKDNALNVAVNLLNSKYIDGAFQWACVHGFAATADELAMVKASWKVIETALSPPPSPAAAELSRLRRIADAACAIYDGYTNGTVDRTYGEHAEEFKEAVREHIAAVTAARGVK